MGAFKEMHPGYVPRPIARNTDPQSSHAAAQEMQQSGKLCDQIAQVYELVRTHPNHTALELTRYTTLDRYQISRRLSDLVERGKIRANRNGRICEVGGRLSCTWDVAV